MAIKIIEIELSTGLPVPLELPGYDTAYALLRNNGLPVGAVYIPFKPPFLTNADLLAAVTADPYLGAGVLKRVLKGWLLSGEHEEQRSQVSQLQKEFIPKTSTPCEEAALSPQEWGQEGNKVLAPAWSIIVCTRDRPLDLERCLESLAASMVAHTLASADPQVGEIVVVDNGSASDETRRVVENLPGTRYLRQDRPGLNWARSMGASAARGQILLFTDDDVVVDPGWVTQMLAPFSHPRVAVVTGLVLPMELETPAQELFEVYGGFSRGFERRTFDYTNLPPAAAGHVGAGASMAFRRDLLNHLHLFDAELDAGTAARTGGDAYAFYQVLVDGWQVLYNPQALAWHRHRREYADLRRTLAGYTVGGFAFLTRCWLVHKDWQALAVAWSWVWNDHLRQLGRSLLKRGKHLPLDLVLAQLVSIPQGIWAHFSTYRREKALQLPPAGLHSPEVRP